MGHGDLTGSITAVPSAGNPWPYYRHDQVDQHRAVPGHRRSDPCPVLSARRRRRPGRPLRDGQTPNAATDPFAWYTAVEDIHRVVYVAGNGHVHELAWQGVAPVGGRDLTALSGAPAAQGRVSGGYNPADNTQHVIFRSTDGHLHGCGTSSAKRPSTTPT